MLVSVEDHLEVVDEGISVDPNTPMDEIAIDGESRKTPAFPIYKHMRMRFYSSRATSAASASASSSQRTSIS